VTNLENGRTIRVIVSTGLDSPGLLAMLSRNVATAIGVPVRGIGRIRMIAPSDPVAFSRFTGEQELSGSQPPPASNAVVGSAVRTATTGDLAAATPEDRFYSAIVNRTESYTPPAVAYPQDGSVHQEPSPAWIPDEPDPAPEITETPYPDVPPPVYDPPLAAVPGPDPAQPQPMLVAPAAPPPYPNTSLISSPYAWQTFPPYIAPPGKAPELPPDSVITLERAGERPPQGSAAIEPGRVPVPPPPQQARPDAATSDDTYLDPRYFLGPIPQPVRPPQPPARIINAPQPAPRTTAAPQTAMPPPQAAVPAASGSIFSVPIISRLEDGKQYVQIGSFTRPDTLETAVARANRSYPLAVQTGGSNSALVYRLLIGPLNAGESAATLQRVRSSGFPDAFVRK
jgi:hypothetical protein